MCSEMRFQCARPRIRFPAQSTEIRFSLAAHAVGAVIILEIQTKRSTRTFGRSQFAGVIICRTARWWIRQPIRWIVITRWRWRRHFHCIQHIVSGLRGCWWPKISRKRIRSTAGIMTRTEQCRRIQYIHRRRRILRWPLHDKDKKHLKFHSIRYRNHR